WSGVRVGVGASSALLFRFDLHSIRLVERDTLEAQERFAKAPPQGAALSPADAAKQQLVLGQLRDTEIPRPAGHPDARSELALEEPAAPPPSVHASRGHAAGKSAPSTQPVSRAPATNDGGGDRVRLLAKDLKGRRDTIVIEGYADAGEVD